MKPVDQIIFEEGRGDCLRACVASILEVRIDDVPNFAEDGSFLNGMAVWLEKRGLRSLRIDWSGDGYDHSQYVSFPGGRCILCGKSPRSTPEKRKGHAVVGRANGWGFLIEHDPHPSRAGLIGEPESVIWIFRPLDEGVAPGARVEPAHARH